MMKKRMSGDDRRDQIVGVSLRLFSEKGLRGTTTREIAKEAGISEATIFKHFRKKEDLYRAIIDRCCNDSEGEFILKARLRGKRGRDALTELARFIIERYSEDPSFSRLLMFSALEGQKFSEIFIKSKGLEALDYITSVIKTLIKEGELRKRDPELAGRAFLGMVAHYCMTQEIYGFKKYFKKRPAETVAKAFVDIFMDGMAKNGRK